MEDNRIAESQRYWDSDTQPNGRREVSSRIVLMFIGSKLVTAKEIFYGDSEPVIASLEFHYSRKEGLNRFVERVDTAFATAIGMN